MTTTNEPVSASPVLIAFPDSVRVMSAMPELGMLEEDHPAIIAKGQANGDIDPRTPPCLGTGKVPRTILNLGCPRTLEGRNATSMKIVLPNGAECSLTEGWMAEHALVHLHASDLKAAATTPAQRDILPKAYHCVPVSLERLKGCTFHATRDNIHHFFLTQQQFLALLYASADQNPDPDPGDNCECCHCELRPGGSMEVEELGPFAKHWRDGGSVTVTFACTERARYCPNKLWFEGAAS